jgi:hypothetical protein
MMFGVAQGLCKGLSRDSAAFPAANDEQNAMPMREYAAVGLVGRISEA